MWFNLGYMSHDAELVQGWLSVEKNDVSIYEVSLDYVSISEFLSHLFTVTILQEPLHLGMSLLNEVRSWMYFWPILH